MKHFRTLTFFGIASVVLLLTGCAGTNFVRPDSTSLVLGVTTQQDVYKKMGKPYRTGETSKNEKTFQTASYAYASGGASLFGGVTPARSQGFYFYKGILVGTEFTSSFMEDATYFDASKLAQIEKGKTTREEVIQLLGSGGGNYIYPLINSPEERADVYLYAQTKGTAFNLKFYNQTLIVTYDQQGIVSNVEYTTQGTK